METRVEVSQFYLKAETYNEMVLQPMCYSQQQLSELESNFLIALGSSIEGRESKWNVYEEKNSAVQLNELERNDPIEALIVGKSQKNFQWTH